MAREFKATFIHRGEWWIGWSDDVPGANSQERTLEKARESLKEAVADILAFDADHGDTSSLDAEPTETIRETLVVEAA